MRFTAQEEYGLRCLLQIGRDWEASLTIPEIAEREGLSEPYVAKLLRVLRGAGLVRSTRGQKGGYQLSRPPEQIRVGAVLTALGGRLYTSEFCGRYTGTEQVCVHNVDCAIRTLWSALDAVVEQALAELTLRDLLCGAPLMNDWAQANLLTVASFGVRNRGTGGEQRRAGDPGMHA